jgi:hypothetical protein
MINQASTETNQAQNRVNVEALLGARAALTDAPEAAKFNWRVNYQWVSGTHSKTDVHSYFGLGAEQNNKTTFSFDTEHPEVFAFEDHGATPVEYILVGFDGS